MKVLTNPFLERIRSLPDKARLRYTTITDRRKQVKNTFWSTLKQNLNIIINFVDRKFVLSLFDERYLLKKIDVTLEKLIESIIPRFESVTKSCGPFEKAVLENSKSTVEESIKVLVAGDYNRLIDKLTQKIKKETANQNQASLDRILKEGLEREVKDELTKKVTEAQAKIKELREQEEKDTEKQIKEKVRLFSDLVASDVFIFLPSDFAQADNFSHLTDSETVQEILATNISYSVYNHLKQYKTQIKGQGQERVKDTTQMELQYLFLFKMAVFEKNYHEFKNSII